MEKKRRSRTRRDQPAANKPGQPYQKSHPAYTNRLFVGPANISRSLWSFAVQAQRRFARLESRGIFLLFRPSPAQDFIRRAQITILFSHFSLPELFTFFTLLSQRWNLFFVSRVEERESPLRASLPIPTPTFDHFQHMALTTQSTPDSLSPSSPGYHELQSYSP
jgi:hypothetical protein